MLTLNHTTLFYLSLSETYTAVKEKVTTALVSEWVAQVEQFRNSKTDNNAHSAHSGSVPGLTAGSTCSSCPAMSIARSALNNNIKVKNADKYIEMANSDTEGGFSDWDEIQGAEQEFAVKSPPKGKKRVTSTVNSLTYIFINSLISLLIRPLSKSKIQLLLHQNPGD